MFEAWRRKTTKQVSWMTLANTLRYWSIRSIIYEVGAPKRDNVQCAEVRTLEGCLNDEADESAWTHRGCLRLTARRE